MPAGRPSDFNPELAERICTAIADGAKWSDLNKQGNMPSWGTIWRWTVGNEEFREAFAQARVIRAERWAFEIEDIADEPAKDMAAVTRARLRVDTRKWLLSKLLPKVYGDKLEVSGNVTLSALIEASQSLSAPGDDAKLIEADGGRSGGSGE